MRYLCEETEGGEPQKFTVRPYNSSRICNLGSLLIKTFYMLWKMH